MPFYLLYVLLRKILTMPQVTANVSEETLQEIQKIKEREKRSTAMVAGILIERGLKERTRKTKKQDVKAE